MQDAIINVNGEICDADHAKVSVFDRSYLYGDSIYEVARTFNGQKSFFLLDEHLARLQKSSRLCLFQDTPSADFYKTEIYRTLDAFKKKAAHSGTDAYCRIVVSRGAGRIGFASQNVRTPPLYSIIVRPLEAPTQKMFREGYRLKIVERIHTHPETLDPGMKSGNYLNNVLAYLEATAEGYSDALLCSSEGFLAEGTTFNLFYARRGIVATPPVSVGILDGVTRAHVLHLARELKLPTREVLFPAQRLYEADEVFLTSTIRGVFPITRVDGHKIANGKPGPITLQLSQYYHSTINRFLGPTL